MITKCILDDKKRVIQYIGKHYPECLYLYLDLNEYAFKEDFVNVWTQEYNNSISSVILQYKTGAHVFSDNGELYNAREIVFLLRDISPDMVCARADIIECLKQHQEFSSYDVEYGHVGLYTTKKITCTHKVDSAKKEDFHDIAKLLYADEGIGASYELDELKNQLFERNIHGFSRNLLIKEGNNILCHVCTGAEYSNIAIISGVVTNSAYRGIGLASQLLAYLCEVLYLEGKEVYSVYYTVPALNLHHKVGFTDCCSIGKLFIKKH